MTAGSVATTLLAQSGPLPASISESELELVLQSLNSIGANNVTVGGIQGKYFDVTFGGAKGFVDLLPLQIQSGLSAAPGKTAAVNFSTFGVRDYLLNATSATADIEIELTESGERNTIILQSCTLTEELITQASLT